MTTKTHVITIYDCPKSVNAGGGGVRSQHWGVAHKEKARWQGQYLKELLAERVRKRMDFCTIDITIRWKRPNHRDLENYRHPVVKPLLDAMVKGGYLEDDTDEWVDVHDFRFEHPPEWPHCDPRRKVELVIKLEAMYL